VTTTTVRTAVVPNAVAAASGGLTPAEQAIQAAGFVPYVQRITSNTGACYYDDPLNGKQEWDTNKVLSQSPIPGTVAPVGSTVTLNAC
jgi:hypothetical protein